MKKKYITSLILITGFFIIVDSALNTALTNTSGAPAAHTGSPSDVSSCTSCHGGTATTQAGMITSNIPLTGYVPGNTYTVTASVTAAGKIKFGCEVSPQKSNGQLQGTMTLINAANTQLIGSGKYITHTTAGTSGSGTKAWSFKWTAPVAGSGDVIFHGAFNITNNNNLSTGDLIKLSTLTVQEDLANGIMDNTIYVMNLNIFPNPSQGSCFVSFTSKSESALLTVFDIHGKNIYEKKFEHLSLADNQTTIDAEPFTPGIYFISIQTQQEKFTGKLIKK